MPYHVTFVHREIVNQCLLSTETHTNLCALWSLNVWSFTLEHLMELFLHTWCRGYDKNEAPSLSFWS